MNQWETMAVVIAGVVAATAILVWLLWRLYRSTERAERDPRYLRRVLLRGAILYGGAAILGIYFVLTGQEPVETLIGLPVVGLLGWLYMRQAMRVQVPPK